MSSEIVKEEASEHHWRGKRWSFNQSSLQSPLPEILHRHNERRYIYEMSTRIKSRYIQVKAPVGTNLFGKLSRLVAVSDTALSLYGLIPERQSGGGMQRTPGPGPQSSQ